MIRPKNDRVFLGVASGLALEFGVDPLLIRLAFLIAFLLWGFGPILYLLIALLTKSGD